MTIYPYYRLVTITDGKVVTGNAIKPYLKDLVVPDIIPLEKIAYPPRPDDSSEFTEWMEQCAIISQANQALRNQWLKQFEDFAADLRLYPLILARMYKLDPDPITGIRLVVWKTDVDMGRYGHLQCAQKLMGYSGPLSKPADPIEFIANQKFG